MLKFLAALFGFLFNLLKVWDERRWKEEGRQKAAKEAADELQHQVELAEHVAVAVDPDYDDRLRARFDAARGGK